MKKPYLIVIALLAVFGVAGFAMGYYGEAPKVVVEGDYIEAPAPDMLGAVSGPDVYNRMYFRAGYQSGGTAYATSSTASAYTLTNTELGGDISHIEWTANLNTTLTTPASTTMPWLGNTAGDMRTYTFYAASSTAASTITLAAGTGVDLQEDEGETVVINGLEVARLTFLRKINSDVVAWLEVGQVGD
jgi:hypothetical protein